MLLLNSTKPRLVIVLFLVFCCCLRAGAQTINTNPDSKFRIIGYLRDDDIARGNAANFDFSKITHLNVAFLNPGLDGNYNNISGLSALIATAHQHNVKVLASIGGGSAPVHYSSLLNDTNRAAFVNKTIQMVVANQFDGVDIDLEGPRIDSNYEHFVTELSVGLKQQNKLLTAAVATSYRLAYTDKALACYDFINIMSYDKTGPWRPMDAGQHSPYEMAVADLDYWGNTRNIPKYKLNLGVPFYGYGFGAGTQPASTFKAIVTNYPGAEATDQVTTPLGGTIYYNGFGTMAAKTVLALKSAGGIMIWQLLQDADADKSLLNIINATVATVNKN